MGGLRARPQPRRDDDPRGLAVRRLGVAAAALALASCTVTGGPPEVAAAKRLERPSPPPAVSEPPESGTACEAQEAAEIGEVVDAQLEAFRRGDYPAALELASRGFRSQFDAERFEQVMTEGFPEVLESTSHRIVGCLVVGRGRTVLVELRGDAGDQQLVYRVREETAGWRIEGAVPHDAPADDDEGDVI
jgi:hypothetical protein